MNLLHHPWMPVRDAAGQRHWITPDQLSDPQWLAFDADRPDFNGALAQFAIGLLQTTTPVGNSLEWRGLFNAPPTADLLAQWFGPVAAAFELDGEGPRFMQDIGLGTDGVAVNDISGLLIDAPGENTVKKNIDHFVKRSRINALCPACAATALFTLQLNAPSGGNGHRTGLRGGGPLTTLVLAPAGGHLWHDLWMNVRDRPAFLAQGGDADKTDAQRSFPWLGPITLLQAKTGELAQAQIHPSHLYWAMPRRIRLETGAHLAASCDNCGRLSEELISRYSTKNHGLNYKGDWSHPLSPYRNTEDGCTSVHPQPDGLGYKHWLGWVLGIATEGHTTRAASIVDRALLLPHRLTGGQLRLWAFGFDMNKAKPRCWYESTLPLYSLADCDRDTRQGVQAEVARWLAAAELAGMYLRNAVKDAWFSADARGDFGHIDATFWGTTEPPFYRHLQTLIEAARSGAEHPALAVRQAWHATLVRTALRLFDQAFVGTGAIERQNPRRTALAHKQLGRNLHGPKLRMALGLPTDDPGPKPARKSSKGAAKPPAKESA